MPEPARRVLMIAPTSFFADYGCHVRILEQARGLAGRGYQLVLCAYHSGRDVAGLDIRRTPPIPWRRAAEVGASWHKLALDLFLFFLAWRTARRWKPQIIHAYLHEGALIGAAVGRLLGLPALFDFQGSLTGEMADHGFLNPRGLAYRPMRRLERWIDRRPRLILTNGQHSARLLVEEFGAPAERLRLAPDVVDTARFYPSAGLSEAERQARRAALGIPPEALLVVYLGLLAPYQGIDLLLQAMAAAAPLRLLLMGFPNIERYQRMAEALGVAGRVVFSGPIRYDDAPAMLALGDIAVGPKISATEGSGKLLNYMALGLPTAAFDTPVSREYLGAAGVLAPMGDAAALAAALLELAGRPAERQARGAALRRRAVEQFGVERSIAAIEAAYRELLGGAPASARGRET